MLAEVKKDLDWAETMDDKPEIAKFKAKIAQLDTRKKV
jgi:hypothetical protein